MPVKTFFKRRSSCHNQHHVFEHHPHTRACPRRCAPHSAVRKSARTRALGPAQRRHDCSTSPTRFCQATQVSTVASEHRRTHTTHRPAGKSRTYPDRPPHFVHFWGVKRQQEISHQLQKSEGWGGWWHHTQQTRIRGVVLTRGAGQRPRLPAPGGPAREERGRHQHTDLRPQAQAALQAE